jgi:hypothetical protein
MNRVAALHFELGDRGIPASALQAISRSPSRRGNHPVKHIRKKGPNSYISFSISDIGTSSGVLRNS